MNRPRYSSLDELENQNSRETLKHHAGDVALIERVLNDFLPAFDALHGYRVHRDWERLLLILTGKAFNSLNCACQCLLRAYYSQALTLVRTVDEDHLTCLYVHNHRNKARLWLKGRKVPSFHCMRSDLGDPLKGELGESYRILSTFAHPAAAALAVTVDRLGGSLDLRLGGRFDPHHFTFTAYMLLPSATMMLGIPAIFLHDTQAQWFKKITATRDEVTAWVKRINKEVAGSPL